MFKGLAINSVPKSSLIEPTQIVYMMPAPKDSLQGIKSILGWLLIITIGLSFFGIYYYFGKSKTYEGKALPSADPKKIAPSATPAISLQPQLAPLAPLAPAPLAPLAPAPLAPLALALTPDIVPVFGPIPIWQEAEVDPYEPKISDTDTATVDALVKARQETTKQIEAAMQEAIKLNQNSNK